MAIIIISLVTIQKCPQYDDPRSGEWYLENFEILRAGIIAKYYVQVMLLFAAEFLATHKVPVPFFLRLKKRTQASKFVKSFYVNGRND